MDNAIDLFLKRAAPLEFDFRLFDISNPPIIFSLIASENVLKPLSLIIYIIQFFPYNVNCFMLLL